MPPVVETVYPEVAVLTNAVFEPEIGAVAGAVSIVVETLAVAVCVLQPPLVAKAVTVYGLVVPDVTDTAVAGLVVPILALVADHVYVTPDCGIPVPETE